MKKLHRIIILISLALFIVSGVLMIFSNHVVWPILAHYNYPSFFEDFLTWHASEKQKTNDTLSQVLRAMSTTKTTFYDNVEVGEQFVDINGDGLLDFLYYSKGPLRQISYPGQKLAVFINKGNFTFEPIYKCVIAKSPPQQSEPPPYYGDCAQ